MIRKAGVMPSYDGPARCARATPSSSFSRPSRTVPSTGSEPEPNCGYQSVNSPFESGVARCNRGSRNPGALTATSELRAEESWLQDLTAPR